MEESPIALSQDEGAAVSLPVDEATQPEIGGEEEGDFIMEDVDDAEEERELLEDELRRLQKVGSVATITSLKMKPDKYSRMHIPLCRLVPMPIVRPTLSSDLQRMEQEFAHGYLDGMAAFYVSITNEAGESSQFTDEEVDGWDD